MTLLRSIAIAPVAISLFAFAASAQQDENAAVAVRFEVEGKQIEVLVRRGRASVLVDEQLAETSEPDDGVCAVLGREDQSVLAEIVYSPDVARFEPEPVAPRLLIGVNLGFLDEVAAAQLDLDPAQTMVVLDTVEDMPAAEAGVRKFDIVTHIDGSAPATRERLSLALSAAGTERSVELRLLRKGQVLELEVRPRAVLGDNVSFVDVNGDGMLDLYVGSLGSSQPRAELYSPELSIALSAFEPFEFQLEPLFLNRELTLELPQLVDFRYLARDLTVDLPATEDPADTADASDVLEQPDLLASIRQLTESLERVENLLREIAEKD